MSPGLQGLAANGAGIERAVEACGHVVDRLGPKLLESFDRDEPAVADDPDAVGGALHVVEQVR